VTAAARRRPGYLGRLTPAELDAAGSTADNYDAELAAALERVRRHAADVATRSAR